MELTILGCGTPHPRPGQACSGYLLNSRDTCLWIDAGPGTLANLLAVRSLAAVDAIWISHLHADHTVDLLQALYAMDDGGLGRGEPVPVHGPGDLRHRLAAFLGKPETALDPFFTFHDLHDGHTGTVGDLVLTSREVEHGSGVDALALRVTDGDSTFAYTGDSGPCAALDQTAHRVDLLLSEANTVVDPVDAAGTVHLSAQQAGGLATRADVATLVLTHVNPPATPGQAVAQARTRFAGPIHPAHDGVVFEITAQDRRREGAAPG